MAELTFALYAFLVVLQVSAGTADGSAGRTEVLFKENPKRSYQVQVAIRKAA